MILGVDEDEGRVGLGVVESVVESEGRDQFQ